MDARSRLTSAALAYGEIVWVRRPGAGVKLAEAKAEAGDGGKKAGHQGELEVSRKAIAQGRPGVLR